MGKQANVYFRSQEYHAFYVQCQSIVFKQQHSLILYTPLKPNKLRHGRQNSRESGETGNSMESGETGNSMESGETGNSMESGETGNLRESGNTGDKR